MMREGTPAGWPNGDFALQESALGKERVPDTAIVTLRHARRPHHRKEGLNIDFV